MRLTGRRSSMCILSTSLTTTARATVFGGRFPRHRVSYNVTRYGVVNVTTNLTTANGIPFTDSFTVFTTKHTFRRIQGSINCPRLGMGVNTARTKVSINRSNTARRYGRSVTLVHAVPNVIVLGPDSSVRTGTTMGTTCRRRNPICVHFNHLTIPVVGSHPSCGFRVNGNIALQRNGSITVVTANLYISRSLTTTRGLTTSNVSTGIVGVRAVGPLSRSLIITTTGRYNGMMAIRRRSIVKNLNSTMYRALSEGTPAPMGAVNMRSYFNRSNPTITLLRGCNLGTRNVCTSMGRFI